MTLLSSYVLKHLFEALATHPIEDARFQMDEEGNMHLVIPAERLNSLKEVLLGEVKKAREIFDRANSQLQTIDGLMDRSSSLMEHLEMSELGL
jgi:hypothetical protein